jgi:pilus assembly protein Flp/PilA
MYLYVWLMSQFDRLNREEEGQDLVEYAMLVALIALIAAVGVKAFGGALNTWFSTLAGKIPLS